MRLRSAYDREILRLAVPALGALAAEPLYILVDTAIVGHLGRSQLAALGAAATVLSVLAMFNFLQYGTTAQVARASGAGEDRTARRLGAQALWLSLAIGVALAVLVALLAGPIVDVVGVEEQTAASHSLAQEAAALNELLTQFKLGGGQAAPMQKAAVASPASRPVASPARALASKVGRAFGGGQSAAAVAVKEEWTEF